MESSAKFEVSFDNCRHTNRNLANYVQSQTKKGITDTMAFSTICKWKLISQKAQTKFKFLCNSRQEHEENDDIDNLVEEYKKK